MGLRIYETEEDRRREALFMRAIEERCQCSCVKLPYKWEFDMMLTRGGNLVALGEMKQRNCESTKYPTVVVGESKLKKALFYSERFIQVDGKSPVPVVLFVRYTDGDRLTKISSLSGFGRERFAASNHADDPTDTEWVVHIPTNLFKSF